MPVIGVSLALNLPRVAGSFAGYPHDQEAIERLLRSRVAPRSSSSRRAAVRQRMLDALPRELTAAAVYGGHAVGRARRGAAARRRSSAAIELAEPLDALVIGIPPTTPFVPRERPNPVSAAYLGLGLALRLWRNAPPIAAGRHGDPRPSVPAALPAPTQTPYRALFFEPRTARDIDAMRAAEEAAASDDERAIATTAPAAPAIRCSRSSSGARATRPRTGSAPC